MDAKLRVTLDKEVYVVAHDFQLKYLGTMFRAYVIEDAFQSRGNFIAQHLTSVLWAPYDVIFTRVHHVVIGLETLHVNVISQGVN